MKKKKLSYTVALWWIILCAVLGLFLLAAGRKDSRLSETENRMLAGFPALTPRTLLSGEFMSGFDAYLSDAFFGRDRVIALTNRLVDGFSALSADERLAMASENMENRLAAEGDLQAERKDGESEPDSSEQDATAPSESEPETPVILDADAVETDEPDAYIPDNTPAGSFPLTDEHSYLWLVKADGGNELIYTYDNKDIATYAETLRLIQGYLPDDGNIFVTQVPLASIGNRWTDQQNLFSGWGSSVEVALERELANDERIYVYSPWTILAPYMTGDTPMFYKTDHHWSAEAAYIVFSEMLKTQHLPVTAYDEYRYTSIRSNKDEYGRTDTFNVLHALLPAHSYIVTRAEHEREIDLMNYDVNSYLAFMNNSRQPWRRVVTGANTGRKALVICDSFGNDFAPYLLPYYDEVHMTDFRYGYYDKREAGGTMGELVKRYGIDDIYLVFSTANGLRKDNSIVYLRKYFIG